MTEQEKYFYVVSFTARSQAGVAIIIATSEAVALGYTYYLGGVKLDSPILERPEDYEELTQEELHEDNIKQYPSLVEKYIRCKYSVLDELALQRQREEKKREFEIYYNYCESCKIKARHVLGLDEQ